MTAQVIPFTSRNRNQGPTCGCTRHVLEALTARTRGIAAENAGQLLAPADQVRALAADVAATVELVLADMRTRAKQ